MPFLIFPSESFQGPVSLLGTHGAAFWGEEVDIMRTYSLTYYHQLKPPNLTYSRFSTRRRLSGRGGYSFFSSGPKFGRLPGSLSRRFGRSSTEPPINPLSKAPFSLLGTHGAGVLMVSLGDLSDQRSANPVEDAVFDVLRNP